MPERVDSVYSEEFTQPGEHSAPGTIVGPFLATRTAVRLLEQREILTIAPFVTIGAVGIRSGKKRKSFPKFDCYRM
jgi:hypothetical protein